MLKPQLPGWGEGTPRKELRLLQQAMGHYFPPWAHSGTLIGKEFRYCEAKNRKNVCCSVTRKKSEKKLLSDLGKQVVPFTGIRNPGGEVGLGDEGRKEFTVSHNEFETCRISYLVQVLQFIMASLSMAFYGS